MSYVFLRVGWQRNRSVARKPFGSGGGTPCDVSYRTPREYEKIALLLSYRHEGQRGLGVQPLQVQPCGARSLGEGSESYYGCRCFYLRYQVFDAACKIQTEKVCSALCQLRGCILKNVPRRFGTKESQRARNPQFSQREECPHERDCLHGQVFGQRFFLY